MRLHSHFRLILCFLTKLTRKELEKEWKDPGPQGGLRRRKLKGGLLTNMYVNVHHRGWWMRSFTSAIWRTTLRWTVVRLVRKRQQMLSFPNGFTKTDCGR